MWNFVPLGRTSALIKGKGPGVWVIGTVHGEEPAGFCAIMESAALLSGLGFPMVVIPCANLSGIASAKRYGAEYPVAGIREDGAFRRGLIGLGQLIRPRLVLDLHEDDEMPEEPGVYLYHHGKNDRLASKFVDVLRLWQIPIQGPWATRFGENLIDGVVKCGADASIDDFLNTRFDAEVVVFETPIRWSLRARIEAQRAAIGLLRILASALEPELFENEEALHG